MRQFNSLLALLPAVVPAIAYDVRIAMFDTQPASSPSHDRSVSSETAELILERRLGRPGLAAVGQVDEQVVHDLNEFGGQQPELFGGDSQEKTGRLVVTFEGTGDVDASILKESVTSDIVAPQEFAGSLSSINAWDGIDSSKRRCHLTLGADDGLVGEFKMLLPAGGPCPWEEDYNSRPLEDVLSDVSFQGLLSSASKNSHAMLNVQNLASSGVEKSQIADILSTLRTITTDFNVESTVVFLPVSAKDIPNKRAPNHRRDIYPEQQPSHISTPQGSSRSSPAQDSNDRTSVPRKSPTLSTLMPVCYASNSSCNDATEGCSGHGFCFKRYGEKAGNDSVGDCWACRCGTTVVRKDDNGKPIKTVQWGGAACQKKDVSMPFFLLGGITVLLVVIIGGVIGMMLGMGMEELPSVLSSGVTAAKK